MAHNSTTLTPEQLAAKEAYAAETNLPRILGVTTTIHAIALVFVVLRIYARVVVLRAFGWDDAVMIPAALGALAGLVCFILQGYHGLGRHSDTISKEDMTDFSHIGFWQSVISAGYAIGFLKVSIGLALLRLSTIRWYRWSLYATITVVTLWTLIGRLSFFLHCKPMAKHWDKNLDGSCYSIALFVRLGVANTVYNMTTEIILALVPVPIIWKLQMKLKTKLYLIGIFSLGYLAVAMGLIKAVYQLAFEKTEDKTFNQSVPFWGFLQLNVGIIAACAPTLKPLVSRTLGLSSNQDQYKVSKTYGSMPASSRRGATRLRSQKSSDRDDLDFEMSADYHQNLASGLRTNRSHSEGSSSSEEMNHPQGPQEPAFTGVGILKTTQIVVR